MSVLNSVPSGYDLRPAYYDNFHCLASDCNLSCCKGWRIVFDKKDYMSLKRLSGSPELNSHIRNALKRIRGKSFNGAFGEFRMIGENDSCLLRCENGLCMLQVEKGHEILPFVCRIFPRKEVPSCSGYYERSLSPACEAVLNLLWELPEGVDFRSDPCSACQKIPSRPYTLEGCFQEIRSQCIDFLQDRCIPLPQRILLMGLALQSLVDGETDLTRWMARARLLTEQASAGGLLPAEEAEQHLPSFLINNIRIILSFPDRNDDFKGLRQELTSALTLDVNVQDQGKYEISVKEYQDARARFQERFGGRDYFMENLMVSIFFHLGFPALETPEALWKSYINFCSLYSVYRYLSVMSCRAGAAGDRNELFRLIVYGSRKMVHNGLLPDAVGASFLQNKSSTLAHMAVLLSN